MQTVRDTLRPEFYNRIDEFVVFDALTKQRKHQPDGVTAVCIHFLCVHIYAGLFSHIYMYTYSCFVQSVLGA